MIGGGSQKIKDKRFALETIDGEASHCLMQPEIRSNHIPLKNSQTLKEKEITNNY